MPSSPLVTPAASGIVYSLQLLRKSKRKRLGKQSDTLPAKQLRKDHPSFATGTGGKTLAGLRQLMPTSPLVSRPFFMLDNQAALPDNGCPVYTACCCMVTSARESVGITPTSDVVGSSQLETSEGCPRAEHELERKEKHKEAERAKSAEGSAPCQVSALNRGGDSTEKYYIVQKGYRHPLLDSRATYLKSALDDSKAACAEAGSLITSLISERDMLTSKLLFSVKDFDEGGYGRGSRIEVLYALFPSDSAHRTVLSQLGPVPSCHPSLRDLRRAAAVDQGSPGPETVRRPWGVVTSKGFNVSLSVYFHSPERWHAYFRWDDSFRAVCDLVALATNRPGYSFISAKSISLCKASAFLFSSPGGTVLDGGIPVKLSCEHFVLCSKIGSSCTFSDVRDINLIVYNFIVCGFKREPHGICELNPSGLVSISPAPEPSIQDDSSVKRVKAASPPDSIGSHTSFFVSLFQVLKKGSDFSADCDKNLLKLCYFLFSFCTSMRHLEWQAKDPATAFYTGIYFESNSNSLYSPKDITLHSEGAFFPDSASCLFAGEF
ncbi:hypothetical protein Tco_1272416 [Tanacetum coccineum]